MTVRGGSTVIVLVKLHILFSSGLVNFDCTKGDTVYILKQEEYYGDRA